MRQLIFIGLILSLSCKEDLPPGPTEIATEIIGDTLFEKGFALTPLDPAIVQQGGGFDNTYLDTLDFGKDGSSPVWMLAQWHSKYDLADTPPADGLDGRIEYANEGKKIALYSDHSLWLEVDASKEYDSARVSGQQWPHLLIAQNFNETGPNVGEADRLAFSMAIKFAMHKYISKKLGALFYFAHPYSSWERGLNEYTNRLIRQYIPKITDFNDVNNLYVNEIIMKLNRRPRKKLNYNTPGKIFLTSFDNIVALAS